MSNSDQDRDFSPQASQPIPDGATKAPFEALQRLFLSAFVHQQEQVRREIDHTGRLAAVLSIQQEITSREPDLEEVLSLVSNRALSILGATGSAIALQRNGSMVCRASGGATGPALGAHLSPEFGLSGECLRTGLPMLCNDVNRDPRVDTNAANALGIRSLIVAPVFHHRSTVGVFEVFSSDADFFEKEDAHVVELLGGMITTAISYSSEFEAKKTLQSERSAMLEVIERITPTITRMLEQSSAPAHESMAAAKEEVVEEEVAEEEAHALRAPAVHEEVAEPADIDFGEEMLFPAMPSIPGRPPFIPERKAPKVDEVAAEAHETEATLAEENEQGDEVADRPAIESDDQAEELAVAETPYVEANDREKRAVDSAIEILLSKENVLEPEAPEIEEPEVEERKVEEPEDTATAASPFFKPERRPLPPPVAKPAAVPAPADDFQWPEPETPPLPGSKPGDSAPALKTEAETGSKEEEDTDTSGLGEWSPPALLQSRAAFSAPRGDVSGYVVSKAASTNDFFTLTPQLPAIPPAGAMPASKAVGAPTEPLGRSRGGMPLTLRLRNIMEYVVPAVLTGLLIVIGLQWLSSNQRLPSLLGSKGLKAPPPSMFAPLHGNPVEISLLKIPSTSGLSRSGKEISNRVAAIVGYDRGGANDWSESAKKLGKKLTDNLPDMPASPGSSGSIGPNLSDLDKILPSNALGGSTSKSLRSIRPDFSGPIAQVHLPGEIIDDYVLLRVQPMYPQVARQNNITGMVVLNTVIGKDGSVRDVRALSGNKYLAEAALAAVSQWRYKPFVLNGKPIEVATEVRIAFTRRPAQLKVAR